MRGKTEYQWPRFDSNDYALLFQRVYSITNDFREAHNVLISSSIELGADGRRFMSVRMQFRHNPTVKVGIIIPGCDFADAYMHNAIYGVLNMWEKELLALYDTLTVECKQ